MAKNIENFVTTFSIKNLSLRKQHLFYKFLIKNLSVEEKEGLEIVVRDPVGGKHDIFNVCGVQRDGTVCKECHFVDCRHCGIYQRRIMMEEKNGESN